MKIPETNSNWIFLLIMISLIGCSSQKKITSLPYNYNWFPFEWYSAKINGKQYDKLVMLVPAKLNNIDSRFVMQFDLGSDATSIYGNVVDSYYAKPEIDSFLDKTKKYTSDAGHISYETKNVHLFFGKYNFDSAIYKENYGSKIAKDSLFSKSQKILGTIGSDVFKNKILIIDYPNKRMCVLDKMNDRTKNKISFVNARNKRGRLQIPFYCDNSTYWFLFDTGASFFPIATNKDLWSKLTGYENPTDTIMASSWGEEVKYYGAPIQEKVHLGTIQLESKMAYYTENKRLNNFDKKENIDGITGNSYFLKNVVILDFKNNQFGMLK